MANHNLSQGVQKPKAIFGEAPLSWIYVIASELALDGLLLASILAIARIASRIYASALLQSGPRVGWRAALRLPGR
jgi:hypothetical protein